MTWAPLAPKLLFCLIERECMTSGLLSAALVAAKCMACRGVDIAPCSSVGGQWEEVVPNRSKPAVCYRLQGYQPQSLLGRQPPPPLPLPLPPMVVKPVSHPAGQQPPACIPQLVRVRHLC